MAARTAMVRAQREQKEALELPEASLKALYGKGIISRFEFESSDLARRWANFLGHENFEPSESPTREEAEEFYGYVEGLLDSIYVKWGKLMTSRERLIENQSGD